MNHLISPSARATHDVVVVSHRADRQSDLMQAVLAAQPLAKVQVLNEFSDLVRHLASRPVELVLLDFAGVPELVDAELVLLRAMQPRARLVAVTDGCTRCHADPQGMAFDALVLRTDLPAWLKAVPGLCADSRQE